MLPEAIVLFGASGFVGRNIVEALRGRVGRSHHQAYAYLMVPDVESLTKQAAQRLDAIQQMEELGSGFYLAMHDLEIRGAGEVLGESQSGNMLEVGFQLYNEMLSEAVRALKNGEEPDLLSPLSATTEVNLHAPALLPDDYCGDVHLRLSFYKKLAIAKTSDQIDGLLEELVDRFGKLPPQAQTLIDVHRLRVRARDYGVTKVDATPHVTIISFKPNPPFDAMRIIELVQKNQGLAGIPTGFTQLDKDTNGFHPGQLVIIAARPGLGKSTLALDIAREAAINKKAAPAIKILFNTIKALVSTSGTRSYCLIQYYEDE